MLRIEVGASVTDYERHFEGRTDTAHGSPHRERTGSADIVGRSTRPRPEAVRAAPPGGRGACRRDFGRAAGLAFRAARWDWSS